MAAGVGVPGGDDTDVDVTAVDDATGVDDVTGVDDATAVDDVTGVDDATAVVPSGKNLTSKEVLDSGLFAKYEEQGDTRDIMTLAQRKFGSDVVNRIKANITDTQGQFARVLDAQENMVDTNDPAMKKAAFEQAIMVFFGPYVLGNFPKTALSNDSQVILNGALLYPPAKPSDPYPKEVNAAISTAIGLWGGGEVDINNVISQALEVDVAETKSARASVDSRIERLNAARIYFDGSESYKLLVGRCKKFPENPGQLNLAQEVGKWEGQVHKAHNLQTLIDTGRADASKAPDFESINSNLSVARANIEFVKDLHESLRDFLGNYAIVADSPDKIENLREELGSIDPKNCKMSDFSRIVGEVRQLSRGVAAFVPPRIKALNREFTQESQEVDRRERTNKDSVKLHPETVGAKILATALLMKYHNNLDSNSAAVLAGTLMADLTGYMSATDRYQKLTQKDGGVSEAMTEVMIKKHIIGMEYKVRGSDNPIKLFKDVDITMDALTNWKKMDTLIPESVGLSNGFVLLAQIEKFLGKNNEVYFQLHRRLFTMLATRLLGESKFFSALGNEAVHKKVDLIFGKMMRSGSEIATIWNEHVSEQGPGAEGRKIDYYMTQAKEIQARYRLAESKKAREAIKLERDLLCEKAKDSGVDIGQIGLGAYFGSETGFKIGQMAFGAGTGMAEAALHTTKNMALIGAGATASTFLLPWLVTRNLARRARNVFRKEQKTPESIVSGIKRNASGAVAFGKDLAVGSVKRSKGIVESRRKKYEARKARRAKNLEAIAKSLGSKRDLLKESRLSPAPVMMATDPFSEATLNQAKTEIDQILKGGSSPDTAAAQASAN